MWIFAMPPREPTLKFIEEVMYSKKEIFIVSLYNGVTYKCVQQILFEI
jgi:hypothetical protein